MRTITLIVVHCSANKAGSVLRMADIDRYHRSIGWHGCGYHYVIPADGTIEAGRPEERMGRIARTTTGIPSGCATSADWPPTVRLPWTPVHLPKRRR